MTRPDAASAELLTPRELRFLDLISQGFSNAMIADVMDVSAGTVKDLAGIVYRKLGARDRANATLIGTTLGLIPITDDETPPRLDRDGHTVACVAARSCPCRNKPGIAQT
jgi:DNA-binding CsgD family transcriptional regulator